jgi:hypothetical protein
MRHGLKATNEQLRKSVRGQAGPVVRGTVPELSGRLNGFAAQKGMVPFGWNVDDGSTATAGYGRGEAVARHVVRTVQRGTWPGPGVLSHDNGKPVTIAAYRTLLPWPTARCTLVALPG